MRFLFILSSKPFYGGRPVEIDPVFINILHRDQNASRKIGLLFLYRLNHGKDVECGVWSRKYKFVTNEAILRSKFLPTFSGYLDVSNSN
jgi:hypothetical protein